MDDLHFGMSVSIPPICSTAFSATENFLFIWSNFQCLLLALTLPWELECANRKYKVGDVAGKGRRSAGHRHFMGQGQDKSVHHTGRGTLIPAVSQGQKRRLKEQRVQNLTLLQNSFPN